MACFRVFLFASWLCLVMSVASESVTVDHSESCAVGEGGSSCEAASQLLIQAKGARKKDAQRSPSAIEQSEIEEAESETATGEEAAFGGPIGWRAGGDIAARGQWCQVSAPQAGWRGLNTCPTGGASIRLKVLTYNLFWWNLFGQRRGENGKAGKLIASTSGPEEYDLMGFQECDDIHRVLRDARQNGLRGDYGTVNGEKSIGIAYLKSRWTLLGSGATDVGEDSRAQYFGKRRAQWVRLRHSGGAIVFFANHHGPLPISVDGGCAGVATSYNIMRLIAEHAHTGDAIVLVGDFNAQPHSNRIRALDAVMFRTFSGRTHGGVDHIFSNCRTATSTRNLGTGGSDHDALSAVFNIPSGAGGGGALRTNSSSSSIPQR